MFRFLFPIRLSFYVFLGIVVVSCAKEETCFTLLDASDTGVKFNNYVDEDEENNVLGYGYFYNGGGVAAGDFNRDGKVDLYFTGNMVADRLYLNTSSDGEITFEDITEAAGIKHSGWKTGVSVVDINQDGWLDIYVCRSGAEDPQLRRNLLYVNNGASGSLTFTEQSEAYGLNDDGYTTQAYFFDYDKDGDLDCFLLNHSIQKYAGFSTMLAAFRSQKDSRYGSKLLANREGAFVDVTDQAGLIHNVLSFGLGANVADLNNDGWPDLYVANDYNENDYLFINQKDGTFKEVVREAMSYTSFYSMGTDAADLNNDGWTDVVTLDMLPESSERIRLTAGDDNYEKYQQLVASGFHHQTMRNMLHLNLGKSEGIPQFAEIGQLAGISNTDWSWAVLAADFDNDGWKDLYITNGYARDYTNMEFLKFSMDKQLAVQQGERAPTQMDIIENMPSINEPNYLYRNKGGMQFENKAAEWGLGQASQSNGAVYADLDNDGDLDLVVNTINQSAFVYQNNINVYADTASNYLQIVLLSEKEAHKIGARVTLWNNGTPMVQEFQPARGYQSSMYVPLHFGLGAESKVDSIRVVWGDQTSSVLTEVPANQVLEIKYSGKKFIQPTTVLVTKPLFVLNQTFAPHQSRFVNDFKIQPLLPEMRSQSGPSMAAGDSNGDKREDLFVGGGRGQAARLLVQTPTGFKETFQPDFLEDSLYNDAAAVFVDVEGDGDLDLVVVSEGYALTTTDDRLAVRLYLNTKGQFKRSFAFPTIRLNASTVTAADIDADGDQDLFIGGSSVPGRFPEAQPSVVLLNDGKGQFSQDVTFELRELVTAATFVNLSGQAAPLQLFVVGEWMTPRMLQKSKGKWQSKDLQLPSALWYSLAVTDLDEDGDEDFVVGGLGLNNQYSLGQVRPMQLLYGDFAETGRVIPLLTYQAKQVEFLFASRDELLDQVPSFKSKYTDYLSYSKAGLEDILKSSALSQAQRREAVEYRTGVLRNKEGNLEFEPLPIQAQFSPIYSISVMKRSSEEETLLFLGGNHTHTRVRMGRSTANHGLLCRVDRKSNRVEVVPNRVSGMWLSGELRSSVTIQGGVVVGMYNAPIKFYKP
jgi:hypothetical protein